MTIQHRVSASPLLSSLDPVEAIRGNWLTRRRLTILLWLCLGLLASATLSLYRDAAPPLDTDGTLIGPDFSALWAAGKAGLSGEWALPYQLPWFMEHMQGFFGDKAMKLAWAYPPIFYFVVMPLAALPYTTALIIWLAASFAALAATVRQILPDRLIWLAIIAFPGIFGNAIHGQTGFLTAALFAGALVALPARPVLAGILFASLAYKPQYGLLVPLALLGAGYWRTITAAAVFGILLAMAAGLAFGLESWTAFLAGLQEMRTQSLDLGRNGYHNLQSAFAAVRLYGLPVWSAWMVQGLVASYVTVATAWLWYRAADHRLKAAGLMAGALALTPYCLDYDLVLLGPAIAFFASYALQRGFRPWEQSILALAFLAPPVARYFAFFLGIPLGLCAVLGIFTLVIVRARRDLAQADLAADR